MDSPAASPGVTPPTRGRPRCRPPAAPPHSRLSRSALPAQDVPEWTASAWSFRLQRCLGLNLLWATCPSSPWSRVSVGLPHGAESHTSPFLPHQPPSLSGLRVHHSHRETRPWVVSASVPDDTAVLPGTFRVLPLLPSRVSASPPTPDLLACPFELMTEPRQEKAFTVPTPPLPATVLCLFCGRDSGFLGVRVQPCRAARCFDFPQKSFQVIAAFCPEDGAVCTSRVFAVSSRFHVSSLRVQPRVSHAVFCVQIEKIREITCTLVQHLCLWEAFCLHILL